MSACAWPQKGCLMDDLVAFTNRSIPGIYHTKAYIGKQFVCECKVCSSNDHSIWTITAWYTHPEYLKCGYGKFALHATVNHPDLRLTP